MMRGADGVRRLAVLALPWLTLCAGAAMQAPPSLQAPAAKPEAPSKPASPAAGAARAPAAPGLASGLPGGAPALAPSATFSYQRFGRVSVYRGNGAPREVVLFLSGDGGWTPRVVGMTERLVARGALVVGIDNSHYLAELERASDGCVSPAVDLENLSHFIQSKLALKTYLQPLLVGYSSGATMAYATLAEAPDGTFGGALTLGFCTDLALAKPICRGSGFESRPRAAARGAAGGVELVPSRALPVPWISLQGELDGVCPARPAQAFMSRVRGAETVLLPKVGHGYKFESHWGEQFDSAFARIASAAGAAATAASSPLADLPLTVVPAADAASNPWFGVFLSGDGGWVGLDKEVSQALAHAHIPIVGWDSLKYFWSPRTPDGTARDLDRVIRYYSHLWGKSRVVLVGYSQGADTLPFMVNRLPPATRQLVGLTVLLGPGRRADFEFHFANWLHATDGGLPTAPEFAHWSGSPYLCLYGSQDADAVCAHLPGKGGTALQMPGGHHFSGGYRQLAAQIVRRLPGLGK